MKNSEINDLLRTVVLRLSSNGWPKSSIGKILLGTSGQAQMVNWLKDSDIPNNFGIKPLQKIADLLNYNIHVTFVKDEDEELIKTLEEKDLQFIKELEEKINNYLKNGIVDDRITKKSKNSVDKFVDKLFADLDNEKEEPEDLVLVEEMDDLDPEFDPNDYK